MTKDYPRPEYPRPQFQRERWSCLNGPWEFAFDSLPDLMGDCWTQLTDIEDEPNRLLTEDRRPKVDVERIHTINHSRFER